MHLGEGCVATNVLWREVYAPFGEELTDPAANDNDQGFTGHIKDDALGLTYMQARFYDPVIGRFLSNDPVGFSPARPDMFGRYTYVANDPVNMIDPDGLYGRGKGFTDDQWEKFDETQKQAASDMRGTASDLNDQADSLEEAGDAEGAAGLREEASLLSRGADVLEGDAFTADAGSLSGAKFGTVDLETGNLTVDMGHEAWGDGNETLAQFGLGHESLHSAGLRGHASDTVHPSVRASAYRYGDANERKACWNIPPGSSRARRNPDHIMSRVYP